MVQLLVVHGFIVVYFRSKIAIERMSATRVICLGTDGDSHGRTTAELFTTGLRQNPTALRGVNERNWSGGTRKRRSGLDSITLTTKRTWRRQLRMIWTPAVGLWAWAEHGRSPCIRMEWDGSMSRAV